MKKTGFIAATASVAAASASAITSSNSITLKAPRSEIKNRENLGACSDKFVPRFDGLRFIETLVTAHR